MTDQSALEESDNHGNNIVPKLDASKQYVEEEWSTVNVPLVRPRPEFLTILKMAGASGEIFTKKEICQLLKDYIGSRHLYDPDDPRVVYCGKDPLGKVFSVEKFTIEEVLSLLSKNCTQVPDTCLKRKRHLVSKPLPYQPSSTSPSPSSSFTIAVCRASPVITSSTDLHDHDLKSRKSTCTVVKQRKSSSSSAGSGKRKEKQSQLVKQSSLAETPKTEVQNQSEIVEGHSPGDSKQSEESKSTEGSQISKRRKNRKRRRKSGKDVGGSPSQLNEAVSEPGPSRKRGTSLSITYNDSEDSSYPWYFQLHVEDDDDQESEILSVQDKTTATVHDSTDDLWFVEEESIAVEVDTDGEFAVEYDVESDNSPLTESDISSVKSGEGLLVVCKESDVEFFADYSDTDSEDTEITEADKWICLECKHVNPPLQRYCDRCWKLRAGWLPDVSHIASSRVGNHSKSNYFSDSDWTEKQTKVAAEKSSSIDEAVKSAFAESADFDSGVGGFSSNYPSSQETVKSCSREAARRDVKRLEEKDDCLSKIHPESKDSLFSEFQATEVRHTFSNFTKSASSSLESLESKQEDKNAKITNPSSISDPCMICLSKPKSASLVHGSSGHQVCCFPCAKRLKRRGKVCPVCRRPIQKVIKNYIL